MTVSQPQLAVENQTGFTPRVGLTVEEAATQAWASYPRQPSGINARVAEGR